LSREIQRATAADAAEILDLQKLAYQSEAWLYDDWTLPPLLQTLESMRDDIARCIVLKALEGGRLAGSVRAYASEGLCHVGRLVVQTELQGQGIGTELMRYIEGEFPHTRRFELFTGSRSAGNIRFYERLGYSRAREKVLSPAITLVFMEKNR